MQKISLAYSTCPNDTFIFDAMVHHKIDTEGLEFEITLADVEELNQRAFRNEIDVTKLSFSAYFKAIENYILLNSGSALGRGCGPLLIAKENYTSEEINNLKICIPGENTTANLLLGIAFPEAKNKTPLLFSEIEESILNGKFEAGLIIHENRFTYQQTGLKKLIDLGEFWENHSAKPIPLGGIVVKRSLPLDVQQKVDRVIRRSIEFAFANRESSKAYIKQHAQEMSDEVVAQHIGLYVNDFSVDLGTEGRAAVERLYLEAVERNIIFATENELFLSK